MQFIPRTENDLRLFARRRVSPPTRYQTTLRTRPSVFFREGRGTILPDNREEDFRKIPFPIFPSFPNSIPSNVVASFTDLVPIRVESRVARSWNKSSRRRKVQRTFLSLITQKRRRRRRETCLFLPVLFSTRSKFRLFELVTRTGAGSRNK